MPICSTLRCSQYWLAGKWSKTVIYVLPCFFSSFCAQKLSAQNNSQIIWSDSCITGSFFGKIVSAGYSDFTQVHTATNGDILLAGTIKENFEQMAIAKNYCNVMRLDGAGNMQWTRFIGINDSSIQVDLRVYASLLASNGDVVLALTVNAPPMSGTYVVRLKDDGALRWQKLLPYTANSLSGDVYKDIIQTSDDGFLLSGSTSSGSSGNAGLISKISSDGTLLWRKILVSSSTDITGITEGDAAYYFTGRFTTVPGDLTENYLAAVQKNTGDINWLKWILFNGALPLTAVTEYEFEHVNFNNGLIALTGNTRSNYTGTNPTAEIALYIDENAQVISSTRIENGEVAISPANTFQGLLYDPFKKTGVQCNDSDSSDNYVFHLNNDNTVNWAYRIPMPGAQTAMDLKILQDASVVIAGFSRNPGSNVSANLLRTSATGKLENCSNRPFPLIIAPQTVSLQSNNSVWHLLADDGRTSTSLLDTMSGTGFSWQLQCNSSSHCRISKIQGSKKVCKNSSSIFRVLSSGNCSSTINFSVNGNAVLSRISDSSASIFFPSTGNFMLYARMQSACGILQDSVMVAVADPVTSFSLGADTSICPQNKILLKAGDGYQQYRWQDGSADSFFAATSPGKYDVTVTDACGMVWADTIQVFPAPAFTFSLGDNRIKCNSDTLHLDAPAGFSNYIWSPDYRINAITGQHVVVDPSSDTSYTVAAERYPGCLAFDTIRIQVIQSARINLATVQQLCPGDSVALDAGAGFVNYLWSDGNITARNLVSQPGIYSVTATDVAGCSSSATVTVSNQFCVNDLYVPSAFAPAGINKIFKPTASLPVSDYHLQVFSRWGQLLFDSRNISNGWDGKLNGKEMSSGVMTWVCNYRLQGQQLKIKKGTVLLIR